MKILRTLLNVESVLIIIIIDNDVEIRDHCHITGKYRGSARRDCNTNGKLNHINHVVFYNLKNYDSRLVTQ